MLRIPLHLLEGEAVVLDRRGTPASLGIALDAAQCRGDLTVHVEAAREGEGFYSVRGWVSGTGRLSCDRCLKVFDLDYRSFVEARYLLAGDRGAGEGPEEGPDTVLFEGDAIDLTDEVRQAVELAMPMRALCREDCRGLCAGCGADLNLESCRCPEPPGNGRWDALKRFKPDP